MLKIFSLAERRYQSDRKYKGVWNILWHTGQSLMVTIVLVSVIGLVIGLARVFRRPGRLTPNVQAGA